MGEHRHPITYTCDLCGSGPWREDEVATVEVKVSRPPRWPSDKPQLMTWWSGDACRSCLKTPRVHNPSAEYENTVSISNAPPATEPVVLRFLRWLFTVEAKPKDEAL